MTKKKGDDYGAVVFATGKYAYVGRGGIVRCKILATFEKDPKGFRGFGNTRQEAEAMLRKYASSDVAGGT